MAPCGNATLCPNNSVPQITDNDTDSCSNLPAEMYLSTWLRNYRFAIDVVAVSIIFVCGVTGNTFSFMVLIRDRGRKGTTNFILQSLALFDTLFLICCLFFQVMKTLSLYTRWIDYYNFEARYLIFVLYGTGMAIRMMRNWTVVVVSVERWIGVCRSLQAPVICTMGKARLGMISVVLCSIVFSAPFFAIPTSEEYFSVCIQRHIWFITVREFAKQPYFHVGFRVVAYFIVIIGAPIVMLTVFNFLLIQGVRKANVERTRMVCRANTSASASGSNSGAVHPTRNLEVTRLCIGVVVVYIICELPAVVCEIISYTGGRHLVYILRPLTNMLVSLNSGVNFYIYVFLGKRFRRQFLALVCRRKRKARNVLLLRDFSNTHTTRLGSCVESS